MNAIASHRPYSWAKAWRDLGHEIEVLTFAKHPLDGAMDLERDLTGIKVHEIAYLPMRRPGAASGRSAARWEVLKTLTRRARFTLGSFGDPRLFAYFPLLRKGTKLSSQRRFDLIMATSPPDVVFLAARTLSRRTGTPWVADFRDLWFHDMVLYRSRVAAALAGPLNGWLVKTASVLVTISLGLQKRLSEYVGREAIVSYNGFLEEDHKGSRPAPGDGRTHLAYTGRVYPGKQDPEPLFRALTKLRGEMPDLASRISVDFYGFDDPALRSLIRQHRVEDCVTLRGFVPYRESVAVQRAADVLLFLDWVDLATEGMMTGKLFEYLGSRRPILALGPRKDSEAAQLIAGTGAGATLTADAEIVEYLRGLLISPRAPDIAAATTERYSRERQAQELLASITAGLPR
jgi:glycosyltransferase involved in cell wall biosynthesis